MCTDCDERVFRFWQIEFYMNWVGLEINLVLSVFWEMLVVGIRTSGGA